MAIAELCFDLQTHPTHSIETRHHLELFGAPGVVLALGDARSTGSWPSGYSQVKESSSMFPKEKPDGPGPSGFLLR
jgi:hypothetical protein